MPIVVTDVPHPASKMVYRQVDTDGPAAYWHVEVYSDEGTMFPVGTAYVVEFGESAQLNFLFVADQWRDKGFARILMRAIQQRWPNFQKTSRMR